MHLYSHPRPAWRLKSRQRAAKSAFADWVGRHAGRLKSRQRAAKSAFANWVPADMSRQRCGLLTIIIVLFVLMGCLYSVSTPLFEASDELRHVAVVHHLWQGAGLPVQNPAKHEFYEQEGSQPPLYYVALSLIAQPIGLADFRAIAIENPHTQNIGRADATDNRNMLLHNEGGAFPWRGTALFVHIARLLGVLMGAVTVLSAWFVAGELAPHRDRSMAVRLLAASLTAFNPMFVFISASVNNDNLVIMLTSLSVWMGLRALRPGLSARRSLLLGCALGCAALSKTSGLVPAVVIPLFLAINYLRGGMRASLPKLVLLVPMVGLIAAIAGWFYARNWLLYGEPTGTQMMVLIAGPREHTPGALELIGEWDGFYKAYWGLFGAVNIPMHVWIYRSLEVLLALGAVGFVMRALHEIQWSFPRMRESRRNPSASANDAHLLLANAMCGALFLATFVAVLRWTSMTFASQGRLLFPVISIISAFLAIGLWAVFDRALDVLLAQWPQVRRVVAGAARYGLPIGLVMLTALAPLLYIQPAYALPAFGRLAGEQCTLEQASSGVCFAPAVRTELRFGEGIRWIGFSTQPKVPRLANGDAFELTLFWQALRPIDQNYSLFIKLYDKTDREVFALNGTPGGGMWQTSRWRAGEVIADRYQVRLGQPISMPTAVRMDVGFYAFDSKQNLPAFDGRGQPTGRQRFEVAGVSDSTTPPSARLDGVSGTFALSPAQPATISVDVRAATRVGNKIMLSMDWLTNAPIDADYTIFAQLFDGESNAVAQADGRPLQGAYGTQWWQPGLVVRDVREFAPAATLKPGRYTVRYGLYNAALPALPRVAAANANGLPAQDSALRFEFNLQWIND